MENCQRFGNYATYKCPGFVHSKTLCIKGRITFKKLVSKPSFVFFVDEFYEKNTRWHFFLKTGAAVTDPPGIHGQQKIKVGIFKN